MVMCGTHLAGDERSADLEQASIPTSSMTAGDAQRAGEGLFSRLWRPYTFFVFPLFTQNVVSLQAPAKHFCLKRLLDVPHNLKEMLIYE